MMFRYCIVHAQEWLSSVTLCPGTTGEAGPAVRDEPLVFSSNTAVCGKQGAFVFTSSVFHYDATWQNDSFMIRRPAEDMIAPSADLPKGMILQAGIEYGYHGDQMWVRDSLGGITFFDLTPQFRENPNSMFGNVKGYEMQAWRAYFLGLPRLNPKTVTWNALNFRATTDDGHQLEAECLVNSDTGALEALRYKTDGPLQEVWISYDYSKNSPTDVLPAIFKCSVQRAANPLLRAQSSTTVRVSGFKVYEEPFPVAHFTPSVAEIRTNMMVVRHSNETVFASSKGKFIAIDPKLIQATALQEQTKWKRGWAIHVSFRKLNFKCCRD